MTFTADMTKFCKNEAPDYLDGVIRKTLIETSFRLVNRSPVGDPEYWIMEPPPGYVGGRFRGNWQYGFMVKSDDDIDVIDKDGGPTKAKLKAAAMATKPVGVHFIFNNVDYSERLENGWSMQAPIGIISQTALEFADIIRIAKQ